VLAPVWRGRSCETAVPSGRPANRHRRDGVDTPKTFKAQCDTERRAGEDAKRFTTQALARGQVHIDRAGRDRYGRTLARVWIGDIDLARMLISAGHGRAYHGERRLPWC
jgi:endonuclease YncB( thermonuclease family)